MNRTSLLTIVLISVFSVSSVALFSGCSGPEAFIGGTVTGAGLSNTLAGAQSDLKAREKKLLTEQADILARLESSNDSAERAALEAENAALKKKLELNATVSTGVELTEKAVDTNWTDINQTFPWVNSGIMALLLFLTDKKKRSLNQVLTAVNEGVEKFKAQSDPAQAESLYAAIKERKQINGIK